MGEFEREAKRAGLFNGPLSSCESELQELMKQIDIMMASRKKEWEMDIHALQARLDIKNKELMSARTQMETKHKELGQIRHNLQMTESSQLSITQRYDQQIAQLRNELSGLQKDYERLQKHQSRQTATAQKTRDVKIEEAAKLRTELTHMESAIKGFEDKAKVWDGQRRVYRHQVESLESQRKSLAEKNQELLQKLESYQNQFEKTRRVTEQHDRESKSQLTYCENELRRAHDRLNDKNTQIVGLEDSIQRITSTKMNLEEENMRLNTDLQKSNINSQRFEDELNQLRFELQSRDDLLKASEQESNQLNREILQLNESLLFKDNIIRTLKSENQLQESMELDQYISQIEEKRRENEQLRQNEKTLREEVLRLQHSLDDTNRECAHLNLELASKINELSHLESNELKDLSDKYTKLSEKCRNQEDVFQSTLDGMKKEISSITTTLHERDKTVAYLESNLSTAKNKLTDSQSKAQVDCNELQKENNLLRQHLNTLQQQLDSAEQSIKDRLTNQSKTSDIAIADLKEEEESKLETLKIEHQIEIQELKNRLTETVNRYEGELEKYRRREEHSEHPALKKNIPDRITASSSYVTSPPSQREFFESPNTSQELLSFPELISQSDSFHYQRPNSRASVTSSFVAENKKQTAELEKLINHHITDLKKKTDETIGHYIPKPPDV